MSTGLILSLCIDFCDITTIWNLFNVNHTTRNHVLNARFPYLKFDQIPTDIQWTQLFHRLSKLFMFELEDNMQSINDFRTSYEDIDMFVIHSTPIVVYNNHNSAAIHDLTTTFRDRMKTRISCGQWIKHDPYIHVQKNDVITHINDKELSGDCRLSGKGPFVVRLRCTFDFFTGPHTWIVDIQSDEHWYIHVTTSDTGNVFHLRTHKTACNNLD